MLVALLSAVLLGAVQSVACDMHGRGAARGSAVSGDAMERHAAMATHAATAGMSHHDGDATPAGEEGECACSCIGACTMVAPLATAPIAATLLVTLEAPAPSRPPDIEPMRSPPVSPDRLLPFANGPPRSALV